MIRPLAFAAATLLGAAPALVQEPPLQGLRIELNAASESTGGDCTLSFIIENRLPSDIDSAVFETVLFDASGQVDRLTLFDFGTLPQGRPRVRQFSMPGTSCDGIGRILFNGANTCESADAGPDACDAGLELATRTEIEVIG
ncbi:hypothetical protein EU805_07855 [Salipiger sp. IMCC34102]|uniref:hypothetical protein n=1 Tax=Salipiger sp. IMCC34102 TaxID=2510647 RepID=UPI00101C6040|nr:hypothetical protein [Salipiger sp. IMCC34102]RYH02532.1 hypothetical protein EU805_07855 [Salipiger sp. IMCC34102]